MQAIETAMSGSAEAAARVLHAFHWNFGVLAAVLLCGAWMARRVPVIELAPGAPTRPAVLDT